MRLSICFTHIRYPMLSYSCYLSHKHDAANGYRHCNIKIRHFHNENLKMLRGDLNNLSCPLGLSYVIFAQCLFVILVI